MAEYADLAFIGQYITFMDRGKNQQNQYASNPTYRARKIKRELVTIADTLLNTGSELIEAQLSMEHLIQAKCPDDVMIEDDERSFRIPRDRRDNINRTPEEIEGEVALLRADWPRRPRNLDPRATEILPAPPVLFLLLKCSFFKINITLL